MSEAVGDVEAVSVALASAGALVLVASGAAKIAAPTSVVGALDRLGLPRRLPAGPFAVSLGAAELVVGVAGLTVGRWTWAGVAAFYVALVAVAERLRRLDAADPTGAGCGCFGTSTAPVTRTHVVVNTLAATAAVGAAVVVAAPLFDVVADRPGAGTVLALQAAVLAGLAVATLRDLPAVGATALGPAPSTFRLRPPR